MFFVGISFLVFLIAICLEIYDDKTGRILDKVYLMTAINKNNIENLEKNNIKNNLQKKKEESEESISDPIHKSKKNKKSWEIRKSF